jgi:hypothetical protein
MAGYIISAFLFSLFFYITYKNSPKHAYILIGIIGLSIGVWFIKPIQMYSLLGIVGVLTVMLMSRGAREKRIQQWFFANGFYRNNDVTNPEAFFNDVIAGNKTYQAYKKDIDFLGRTMPVTFVLRYNIYNSGRSMSLVVHCCYFFREYANIPSLEQKLLHAQQQTPPTNLIKSQFHYFDLKASTIFKPAMGGIAITWRVPHSVQGYKERYDWIRNALA